MPDFDALLGPRQTYVGSSPFGIGEIKPQHYRSMLRIAWENRDNFGYAWKILTRGTCDGCALGTIGLHDWTLGPDEIHLCTVRLELLRLNTMRVIPDFEQKMAAPDALMALSSKELRELGRLPYPMRRRAGETGFSRIGWDELFEEAGTRIAALKDPDRFALFCTSRGITNETYYVAQKIARFLGTNNVDNSARLCHAPSTVALKDAIGAGATTCSYKDWYAADLIVLIGTNPANDQPVAMKYLHEAKQRGTRVITINTFREPGMERYWVPSNVDSAVLGTHVSDAFFLVHTGGDLALLNAVQKMLIERDWVDAAFVREHTTGYDALRRALAAQDIDRLAHLAGISVEEIERLAAVLAAANKAVLVWSMGITQHAHGSDTVRAIANVALLRGFIGRPGCGVMPIRGHSGVQGGAEMGCYSTAFPGGKPVNAETAAELSAKWGFEVPAKPGLTTSQMLEAAHAGKVDVFYIVGGNFLETMPQPLWVKSALEAVPVRIHQDVVLTHQMLLPAGETVYVLPGRTRYEQRDGGTETTTERRVILSPEIPRDDLGEAMTEWEILMRLAEAARPERASKVHFDSGRAIRQEISRVVPMYGPIANLTEPGDNFQWGGPMLCAGGRFPTADGRGHLRPVSPPEMRLANDELLLSTRRGKQFNSMVQGAIDPLVGTLRDAILMSKPDADRFGVAEGDELTLYNQQGVYHGKVSIQPIRPGNVQAYWPEANVLLPRGRVDPEAGVPDYNAVVKLIRTGEYQARSALSQMMARGTRPGG